MYCYTPVVPSFMNSKTFWIFSLSEHKETWLFDVVVRGICLQVLSAFPFLLFLVKSVVPKC